MKNSLYMIVVIFLVFAGCQKQPKQYPNVSIEQVFQDLKWDYNYAKVKNIFETKYGLEFAGEMAKGKNKDNFKVFSFEGGKFSGLKSDEWRVAFLNDSLFDVFVMIPSETPKKCAQTILDLRDTINNLPYEKFARINYEWILQKKGEAVGSIQLTNSFGKGIMVFITNNKLNNTCSYK